MEEKMSKKQVEIRV